MVEATLYGNHEDHPFPFIECNTVLSWVVPYIELRTSKRRRNIIHSVAFKVLLNILLVFGRARTSTLQCSEWFHLSKDFVGRLNSCLDLLPKSVGAAFHKLRIVPRRPRTFFVVSDSSPRFNWSRSLTHQQVGRNLDYCGVGQIYPDGVQKRRAVLVYILDSGAQYKIGHEWVFLDEVSDIRPIESFFDKRTALFNHTMNQLGLPYQFNHFWADWDNRQQLLQKVMSSPDPPTAEWWANNYVFVCDILYGMSFASRDTLFDQHWTLLCAAYESLLSNTSDGFGPQTPNQCSETTDKLFQDMYAFFRSPKVDNISETISRDHQTQIALFSSFKFEYVEFDERDHLQDFAKSGAKRFIAGLLECLRMHTLEREKLREPLVHDLELGERWKSYGHELWSRDPLRLRLREVFSKWFWLDRYYQ